jgi:hypothetical protein
VLAEALSALGLRALLMGGHAVRFYGVDRSTIDYDFCVALDRAAWDALPSLLRGSRVIATDLFREGPSWRPEAFRRFVVGALPDGREERLEFWRENHLLAPFDDLYARRTQGLYGGYPLDVLGLDDLIHSKETEREDDWRDVNLLEEIADERRLVAARTSDDRVNALASLRSRRGFERAVSQGLLADDAAVRASWHRATHPIPRAYLLPSIVIETAVADTQLPLAPMVGALRTVAPGSPRHLALVEAVRRLYRREAMAADRADKEKYGSHQ